MTNRMPIAHLAIERGLKALIKESGGNPENIHSLNRLFRDLRGCDKASSGFLTKSFEDTVKFFGYKVNVKGMGYLRSLDGYLSRVGTEDAFQALRYWAIGESPKGDDPVPYILPLIHRELLCALACLFHSYRRWLTVSERVERTVSYAMIDAYLRGKEHYSVNELQKKRSISLFNDWLAKHSTRCNALRDAVNQDFNVKDDEVITNILRDSWSSLLQSNDPAIQYYMSTLTDLPKGSQPRSPDAIPEVKWFGKYQTTGSVETPAGAHLGFIEKYTDGRWGISPSEDGSLGVTDIAETSADAKTYLVNRLTKQVTVTVNGEQRQLRIVRDRDSFPLPERTSEITLPQTYKLEFWNANHGLRPGEQISADIESESNSVSTLEGVVKRVEQQFVWIEGMDVIRLKTEKGGPQP